MADIALGRIWSPAASAPRAAWLDRLAQRARILRRRARRDRYLALSGSAPRRYPWFETMFRSMSGR